METSFGHWVRRRRKTMDLTQDELARRVGCSPSLIFKIETDERRPSRQIAELLVVNLEIPMEQCELFLKVARQERGALRLDDPDTLPVSSRSMEPAAAPEAKPDLPPAANPFSPAENADFRTSGLPVFPTVFVGREFEIDIVVQQLLDPACRLMTLTGPGGVGKTRLAVEVARRLETAFADGVYFLAMAGVDLPESVMPALADALGVRFSGPADPKLQLIQALRKKNMLLILDNMEHLVAGSAVLGEILEQAAGVRLLLTSREPVHLQWEWVFEVQGLPVPESVRPGELESNSAPALFLQRTRQAARRVAFDAREGPGDAAADAETAAEAAAVIQICKLVDGLPLAIELAASWARVMSPGEIAMELAGGLDLLETTLQDVPARHRSIKLVFDHSWKLLTVEEREVLMKLAVFPGGFTREEAYSVAGASVMLLSALVSKSLLRYGKKAGRYDFHELVRHYALARLAEQPDQEQTAYTRQAEYYARWLADLEFLLKSEQQIQVSARIRSETSNWSAAWRWSARHMRLDLLRQMSPCLYWYDEIHGDNLEALAFYTETVSDLRAAGAPGALHTDPQKGAFAILVAQQGWFEFRTGNMEPAVALFNESLAITRTMEIPDAYALFLIFINWGYQAVQTGDPEAGRLLEQSLIHARAYGHPWNIAVSINILGIVEYQRGNVAVAYRQLTDSLKLWREIGDLRGLVFCMLYLSAAAIALEDYDTVEAILQESNAIAQQKLDRWAHAFGLDLLGQVAMARGQVQPAWEYHRQSMEMSKEIGDHWAATLVLIHMGDARLAMQDKAGAQRLFQRAYENAQRARWLSIVLEVTVASLAANDETPPETRLAIALVVLSHSAATLTTRQRAENLRERLSAALQPPQVEAAQSKARELNAEQWAGVLFSGGGAASLPLDRPAQGWSAEASPA